jgi:hypothetical protein
MMINPSGHGHTRRADAEDSRRLNQNNAGVYGTVVHGIIALATSEPHMDARR